MVRGAQGRSSTTSLPAAMEMQPVKTAPAAPVASGEKPAPAVAAPAPAAGAPAAADGAKKGGKGEKEKEKQLERNRILVLGPAGVGKTALVIQLCCDKWIEEQDSWGGGNRLGDVFKEDMLGGKEAVIDGQPSCVMQLSDVPSQVARAKQENSPEDTKAMYERWSKMFDGVLLVYSIVARESYQELMRWADDGFAKKV